MNIASDSSDYDSDTSSVVSDTCATESGPCDSDENTETQQTDTPDTVQSQSGPWLEGYSKTSNSQAYDGETRYRKYLFIKFNWTEEERIQMCLTLEKLGKWFIMAREHAPTTGTPHLQGYVEWKNPMKYRVMLDKLPGMSVKTRIDGTLRDQYEYCMKEDKEAYTNIIFDDIKEDKDELRRARIMEEFTDGWVWRPWQLQVQEALQHQMGKNDDRTVNWFWCEKGGTGKSKLAKYLVLEYDAVICSGKSNDIFNQVKAWIDKHEHNEDPSLVIIDNPRSSGNTINYHAVECLKNGMLYSGKYEGGVCVFKCPCVCVFANRPPDQCELSADRWNIHKID